MLRLRQGNIATLIYFSLPSGKFSKFHKIESDEIWKCLFAVVVYGGARL
ncbi:MAG: cupin domain-containing protein [Sphingomonadales bacterium]|nr:cupin domain-containing protein [Sphingomonadales bacterium]